MTRLRKWEYVARRWPGSQFTAVSWSASITIVSEIMKCTLTSFEKELEEMCEVLKTERSATRLGLKWPTWSMICHPWARWYSNPITCQDIIQDVDGYTIDKSCEKLLLRGVGCMALRLWSSRKVLGKRAPRYILTRLPGLLPGSIIRPGLWFYFFGDIPR